MLRVLLIVCALVSCKDECIEKGGSWESYNCHVVTHFENRCVAYSRNGNCKQSVLVPEEERECSHRCVMPPPPEKPEKE